jgi:hypothetical protein
MKRLLAMETGIALLALGVIAGPASAAHGGGL